MLDVQAGRVVQCPVEVALARVRRAGVAAPHRDHHLGGPDGILGQRLGELPTAMDHLGVEVEDSQQVSDATNRLAALGLGTDVETDTTCCYAVQDKVWVHGPGAEPWEVYVVKADSAIYGADLGLTAAARSVDDTRTSTADCCG
jgi:hypothetical protein